MAKQNDSNELQIYCNSGSSLTHNTKPEQGRQRYLQLLKLLYCKINVAYKELSEEI